MTRTEFIKKISENIEGATQKDIAVIVDEGIETIVNAVASGDKVSFVGFGTFESVERAARTGRNPLTGETLQIPASRSPKFKPGKKFKETVKNA
ncbi:HU family DNA-binding protein [uncultured Eubacterium sp.]|uniref:HU family DNA-binding protein n=1 Tax=uncultured Eubacterium sp. TaxID=165185 RepID=UPI0025970D53|nr:HU family DNA-binding protein [uncultured Eubacterium sp.]